MEALLNNPVEHIELIFSGATMLAIAGHAVNTFPTPTNKYGAWLLGLIQFTVGQRVAASNTFQGKQTLAVAVDTPPKPPASTDGKENK